MADIDFSALPKAANVASAQGEFGNRKEHVLQHVARRSGFLEQFAEHGEEAAMVALCKLELCRRDQLTGSGKGDVPRNPPQSDEITSFDQPKVLTTRELVRRAIYTWRTKGHVGTDIKPPVAMAAMGGYYALLTAAWLLGAAAFTFVIALLLGYGADDVALSAAAYMIGGILLGAVLGGVFGMIQAAGCNSAGDFDMTLMGLLPMLFRYGDLLGRDEYDAILYGLLARHTKGGSSKVHKVVHLCGRQLPFFPIDETENHLLMIETSRYLTNVLMSRPNPNVQPPVKPLYDSDLDNHANGLRDWLLDYLQQFLKHDFWEFNSRPYQRLPALALQNLYEFAPDDEIRKAARIVLDYLSAKFAVSGNALRRAVPFRRRAEKRSKSGLLDFDADEDTWRFLILAGDTSVLNAHPAPAGTKAGPLGRVDPAEEVTLVHAALGRYRVPALILDLILNRDHNRYLQRFRHGHWDHDFGEPAVEVYFSSAKYLISAGGIFADGRGLSYEESEQAWALPTTLMPAAAGVDWKEFVRIEGAVDETRRANTGVAPGFACGLNPVFPEWVKEADDQCFREPVPRWTFINFANAGQCGRDWGFYVAVFRDRCDTPLSRKLAGADGTFGFFAVVEPWGHAYTFDQFVDEILDLNRKTLYTAEGTHTFAFPSGHGPVIDFCACPTEDGKQARLKWPIVRIDNAAVERDLTKWPLAESECYAKDGRRTDIDDWIIKSWERKGCVMVDNPHLDQRLVLDLSNASKPRISLITADRHAEGCRCPLEPRCDQRDVA